MMKRGEIRFATVAVLALALIVNLRGFLVSESAARKALEDQGYQEVTITHHAYWFVPFRGGDQGDAARFTAEAKNSAGKKVTIYVFVGWPLKGATIRSL